MAHKHKIPYSLVSSSQLPSLHTLLCKLLHTLSESADLNNKEDCPYYRRLRDLVDLSPQVQGVDLSISPLEWPEEAVDTLCQNLVPRYADVFNLPPIEGRSLAFDIVCLLDIYSDDETKPAVDHYIFALLLLEGIAPQTVTTNWDTLIEQAYRECNGSCEGLIIVARPADIAQAPNPNQKRLLKIHGCAKHAKADPDGYGHAFVYSQSTIQSLQTNVVVGETIRVLIREQGALFVGLSAQDDNVQMEFVKANIAAQDCPADAPPTVFTGEKVTNHQRNILRAIYRDTYDAEHVQIEKAAVLPLSSRPLFASLYCYALARKAKLIVELSREQLSESCRGLILDSMTVVERDLCRIFDNIENPNDRWQKFLDTVPPFLSAFVEAYREQKRLPSAHTYRPLYPLNCHQLEHDPNLAQMGYHWLLLAVALFVRGAEISAWRLTLPSEHSIDNGQLVLYDEVHRERAVYFVDDHVDAPIKLEKEGIGSQGPSSRTIVVYPRDRQSAPMPRSPERRLPKRSRVLERSEIWLRDIYDLGQDADHVLAELISKLGVPLP